MYTEGQVGFYGKLPAVGDYVSRRLPHDFIDPWAQWLQQGLLISQDFLAERWLDCYLESPVWRFSIGAGLFNKCAWIGVVSPSVDKVGRYYPLTIAAKVDGLALPEASGFFSPWLDQAEMLVCSAMERYFTVDEFDCAVTELRFPDLTTIPTQGIAGNITADSRLRAKVDIIEGIDPVQALPFALATLVEDRPLTLWMHRRLLPCKAGALHIYQGMPTPRDYAQMLCS